MVMMMEVEWLKGERMWIGEERRDKENIKYKISYKRGNRHASVYETGYTKWLSVS